jgi:hypothetical protein
MKNEEKNNIEKKLTYQFFINKDGILVMQPERYIDTTVYIGCMGKVREDDTHEFGYKIY